MTNVIKFPVKLKRSRPVSQKRVFYLGYRYVGPTLCQEVQKLYLKRNSLHNGSRCWSMLGWRGNDCQNEKIIRLFHKSYDGIIFPDFARPLNGTRFTLKIMMQANNIRNILPGRGLYAYTHYRSFWDHRGWVWMNLLHQGDPELKFVPVRIVKRLSEEFQANHYKNPKV